VRIVYNSFHGRYSDSPRVVFERLAGHGDLDQLWLVDPEHADGFAADLRTVDIGSAEAATALESADLVIANTHTEVEWVKSARTTYVQTWHGTPLKRIHRDVLWAPEGRLDRLEEDVVKWDVLVSPNAESTPRLRGGFRYTGEVLEIGYPRNDVLAAPDTGDLRARIRGELGVPPGATAVLYAPTFRDDEKFGDGPTQVQMGLDIPALMASWGPEGYLLARSHPLMTGRTVVPDLPGVVDTSYYPDVRDLYLAADVLVTDYSSVMFDFAITGKPIVLYAYDLQRFREEIRGFYFDLEEAAPGPIVRTTEELAATLADLPGLGRQNDKVYADFVARFCSLEDGHATDRLLARLGL
jgi:CDP-glycerol glycerophosphotransferase